MNGSKNYGTFTQWNSMQQRKKELIPFGTAWMELESIMLSEISQVVKDKYHMISPIKGIWSTKQTSEKNPTRDIEIQNRLTVNRGEWGEDVGEIRRKGCQGTCIKGPWTKPRRVGWRVGGADGWGGGCGGEKIETTVLEK